MLPIHKVASWYFSRSALPYWLVLLFDCLVVMGSGLVCYAFDSGVFHTLHRIGSVTGTLAFYLLFFLLGFRLMHTYSGILRYSSFADLYRIVIANLIGISCIIVARVFLHFDAFLVPIRIRDLIFTFVMATTFMVAARLFVKFVFDKVNETGPVHRAFIYGVHKGGIALAKAIRMQEPVRFVLKGFVSDEKDVVGHMLQGVEVYQKSIQLLKVMREKKVSVLLVSPLKRDQLFSDTEYVNQLVDAGISIYTYDTAQKWDGSDINASQLREVQIEDLLPREEIQVDLEAVARLLNESCILITGSAGSIGSEMVRQIAKFSPRRLVLVDEAETPQHDIRLMMRKEFPEVEAQTIVTSITNKSRMENIFNVYRPEYVFHAAAYKHVPMMEDNPSEAVLNNILGTRVIADLSVKYGVKKFVMVSTDKAVNPTNVMGCSKRAEGMKDKKNLAFNISNQMTMAWRQWGMLPPEQRTKAKEMEFKLLLEDLTNKYNKAVADYDRYNSYLKQLEYPTTWYNVRTYETAMVYITNGRAPRDISRVTNIRNIPYTDKLKVYIYDWEHHYWVDPAEYTVTVEVIDSVQPSAAGNPSAFTRPVG